MGHNYDIIFWRDNSEAVKSINSCFGEQAKCPSWSDVDIDCH